MNFHVGQKVVCVGAPHIGAPRAPAEFRLPRGAIYTIREVDFRAVDGGLHPYPTVRLVEILRPIEQTTYGPWECGYVPQAFRPAVERKTNISIFTRMLTPKKQNAHT